jgi:hypothetical protein
MEATCGGSSERRFRLTAPGANRRREQFTVCPLFAGLAEEVEDIELLGDERRWRGVGLHEHVERICDVLARGEWQSCLGCGAAGSPIRDRDQRRSTQVSGTRAGVGAPVDLGAGINGTELVAKLSRGLAAAQEEKTAWSERKLEARQHLGLERRREVDEQVAAGDE